MSLSPSPRKKPAPSRRLVKVLIVDSNLEIRKGVCSLVRSCAGLAVVGEASTAEEALRKARELSPDLLLTDFDLLEMDGLRVAEVLRKEIPKIKVVLLTIHNTREHLWRVAQAGVNGYLLKDTTSARLVGVLEQVTGSDPILNMGNRLGLSVGYKSRRRQRSHLRHQ